MFAADPQLGLGRRAGGDRGRGRRDGRLGAAEPPLRTACAIRSSASRWRWLTARWCAPARAPITCQDGFDLARLFTGSFGTLGVILAVDVRLRPLPGRTATALATALTRADCSRRGGSDHPASHPRLEAFDVAWRCGTRRAAGPAGRRRVPERALAWPRRCGPAGSRTQPCGPTTPGSGRASAPASVRPSARCSGCSIGPKGSTGSWGWPTRPMPPWSAERRCGVAYLTLGRDGDRARARRPAAGSRRWRWTCRPRPRSGRSLGRAGGA